VFLSCILHANAMYCGDENCYDVIGVSQTASSKDIKKAYRALSLKYHPDKNSEPGALDKFKTIANAYEIISDDARRQEYDYALAHPEQVWYNQYRYYQAEYKMDWRVVLSVGIVLISACQHYYWESQYAQAIEQVKQSPVYRNRLKGLEYERQAAAGGGGGSRKGKSAKERIKKDNELTKIAEEELLSLLDIRGSCSKHKLSDILLVQLFFMPASVARLLWWVGGWIVRYWILRKEYLPEDAEFMTRSALRNYGCTPSMWAGMPDEKRQELVDLKLWNPENMKAYIKRGDGQDRRKGGRNMGKRQGSRTQLPDDTTEGEGAEQDGGSPRKPARKNASRSEGKLAKEQEVADWLVSKTQETRSVEFNKQETNIPSEELEMGHTVVEPKEDIEESSGEPTEEWTKGQEQALVKAVKAFPKGSMPSEKDRWVKIADAVPGKSPTEAFKHMQIMLDRIRSNKAKA